MIRCTTYANLSKVGGTSYIPVLGDGKRLGDMPGEYVQFPYH